MLGYTPGVVVSFGLLGACIWRYLLLMNGWSSVAAVDRELKSTTISVNA